MFIVCSKLNTSCYFSTWKTSYSCLCFNINNCYISLSPTRCKQI